MRNRIISLRLIFMVGLCLIIRFLSLNYSLKILSANLDFQTMKENILNKQQFKEKGPQKAVNKTLMNILNEIDELSGGAASNSKESLKECHHPLVKYQNRIVKPPNRPQEKLIPKVIHMSMKSRCMPRDILRIVKRWEEQFPDHSIIFHDDEAVARLINEEWPEFPNLHKAMKCVMYKGAMTIDIWRILVMWKYGGIYTDIDNWPGDAFNERTIPNDTSAWFLNAAWNRPSQWLIGIDPRNQLMNETMLLIIDKVLAMDNIMKPRVVFVTGPHVLFEAYKKLVVLPESWRGEYVNKDNPTGTLYDIYGKKMMKVLSKSDDTNPPGVNDTILEDYIFPKFGFNDIVTCNGINVTRKDRILFESGLIPWYTDVYMNAEKLQGPERCDAYLKWLKSNETEIK